MKKNKLVTQNKSLAGILSGCLPAIAVLILFTSCSSPEPERAEHPEELEHHEGPSGVTITKKQFDAIKIQLGTIEQKNLTDVLRVTGFLKVPPQNKANVSAILGGTVQSILIQEGDFVQKGQALATLINPGFVTMQQEFMDANSQLTFAKAEYERQKQLSEKDIASKKSFQQAESNYYSLSSKVSGLKQQLSLLGINATSLSTDNISSVITIRSPIRGNVSHIDINIGSTVEPSDEFMDVVDNSQLHLDLFVYEQDLTKIEVGQTVDVLLTNLPGRQYTAKVFAVGSAFEGESKSIPVHAAITGDKTGLIEGMNVTANINIQNNLTTAVPSTAIISNAGKDFIFIQTQAVDTTGHQHAEAQEKMENEEPGFTFSRVEVKKGIVNGAYTEIVPLQPLEQNPKVVVEGAFYLMSILTNSADDAHEH